MVNRYLSNPAGDGGRARIPTLKVKDEEGFTKEVNMNEGKAEAFSQSFLPTKTSKLNNTTTRV